MLRITYVTRGWRFTWLPLDGGTVKIGPESGRHPNGVAVNWSHQMDPPDTVKRAGDTRAIGPLPFDTILRDFQQDCESWVTQFEIDEDDYFIGRDTPSPELGAGGME